MIRHICLMITLLTSSPTTWAQTGGSCASQARTELERAYCKILAANPGGALPSLQELRRNPEKTQRLLLRRPAEQAGIKLPPETAAKPAPKTVPTAPPAQSVSAPPPQSAEPPEPVGNNSLSHCQLMGTSIRCGNEQFRLQGNLPNNRLIHGALDPAQKIRFEEFSGSATDPSQAMSYLSATYLRYLEAMLDIGLGGSTMSFTKFHHTFMEAQSKGTQFGERLSTMFDFLKKDKASMGVQAHYNDEMPQSLAQCMGLGDHLLVCDNVQQNWVYKKTGL